MDRHQHDGIGLVVIVVDVRDQRDLLEEIRQRAFRVLLLVAADVRGKFVHVALAVLRTFRVVGFEKFDVADTLDHLVVQLADRDLRVFVQLDQPAELCAEELHFFRWARERRVFVGVQDNLEQRLARLLADLCGDFHRTVADAALRGVNDPAQAHFVARVADHAEVGDHLADLAALIEARAADDAVRNAGFCEIALEHHRLRIHAVQNRVVRKSAPGRYAVQNDLRDALGLVHFVFGRMQVDFRAASVLRPKRFALALRVVLDDGVCGIQNVLR